MQKKIIALAIAAAFSAPAFADNANVTVYGKAFMTFDQANTDATGGVNKMNINTNASRFGVKGSEDLGDGLKAIYQFEVEMDADGSGNSVATTASGITTPAAATYTSTPTPSGLGKSRNSGAGLEGGFGKVILGIWDSPYKVAHNKIELFDNTTSWSSTNVIGRSPATTKNYNTRAKNMIQYWSPKMGGVQVAAMYSIDEHKTATVNKSIVSLAGTYDEDNLYVSVGYESHADEKTTATTDSAMRAVAKYDMGSVWVGAMLENIKTNTSTSVSVTGSNAELVGGVNFGSSYLAASYAKQGSTAVAPAVANDVSQLTLKLGSKFSKRTELFAAYASNKTNAATAVTTTFIGGGIVHSF